MALPCRIACVRIGRFEIGALGGRPDGPTALVADVRGAPRVLAAGAEAAQRGVAPGMALAEARALAAGLVAVPWDEERLRLAALEVGTTLLAASPRVSWNGLANFDLLAPWRLHTGVWWVDAAGLGEERALARRLLVLARDSGFAARVGIADSAIAAYAATFARSARCTLVTPGADAAFLAPLPLAVLDPDEDLAETLHVLGINTVGALAALEPGEVESRFGPAGLAAHRLARGLDGRGPRAPRDGALPAVEIELGGPVATAPPLLFALQRALGALGDKLRRRGLAARQLLLSLGLDDGSTAERAVRPARPTTDRDALLGHCRAALEDWRLEAPAVSLAVRAPLTVPASGEQGDLLAPRWADPAALEAALDRIRASQGSGAVAVPETRDAHLPEEAGAYREQTPYSEPTRGRVVGSGRGAGPATAALRLLQSPAPVRVRLGRAGIEAFRYAEIWHDVAQWSGPERLAPRWWDGPGDQPPRDYFTARTKDGALWLLLRAGGKKRAWFVGGWWD